MSQAVKDTFTKILTPLTAICFFVMGAIKGARRTIAAKGEAEFDGLSFAFACVCAVFGAIAGCLIGVAIDLLIGRLTRTQGELIWKQ